MKRSRSHILEEESWKFSIFISLIIFCCYGFTGCATLDKNECIQADWRTIGYEDGAKGYQTSRIGKHREACAKHGVTPDFDSYEQGRIEGLREFCTPQKGYSMSSKGKGYNHVCPDYLEPGFLEGYRLGKIVYAAKGRLTRQQSVLKNIYEDLDALERQMNDYETELIQDHTRPKRRRYLLEEIKLLTDEQRSLAAHAAEQEIIVEDARFNLKELQRHKPQ